MINVPGPHTKLFTDDKLNKILLKLNNKMRLVQVEYYPENNKATKGLGLGKNRNVSYGAYSF